MFNIGVLSMERQRCATAIEYFQKVLESKADDKEMGGNIMDPFLNYSHYSAMRISQCYESLGDYPNALRYAQFAQTKYPFQSIDGNAAADAYIGARIMRLTDKVAASAK